MGSNSASGGNDSPNTGPAGIKTDGTYGTKKDAEDANLRNFQQSRKNKVKDTKVLGTLGLGKKAFEYGAGVTSKYFTDTVLTSKKAKKNIGYTRSEFASLSKKEQDRVYSDYMNNRMSGKTDAAGNISPGYGMVKTPYSKIVNGKKVITYKNEIRRVDGKDDSNYRDRTKNLTEQVTAPTTAEVSQSAATQATEDDIILRKRRAKARGKSPTIMSGVAGATGSLTLGKPSLLGS